MCVPFPYYKYSAYTVTMPKSFSTSTLGYYRAQGDVLDIYEMDISLRAGPRMNTKMAAAVVWKACQCTKRFKNVVYWVM